ncbi:TMEM165/GDT1 family protein [Myxococcus sp. K38C18041901]|uniref:TMEM165/GDT1 family protein n=1 Tax=Myxococcus guangdongensis TaxID=2906760 RepID=UPI0020A79501|nr:TMEM165/GDT1 family protein [Myxococcus guangdongensis]MCP3064179.1 TMEM165/GDT1 family protein [Myxococcus guangdongensis]
MLEAIVGSFVLVAASEMGDKTQLLAFSLASRFRKPWVVILGILIATLANHALAASVGTWVSSHVSPRVMAGVLAVLFIAFGLWTLKPDTLEESKNPARFGALLTTIILFFLAEMGDKTQFATVALAARYQSITLVTIGTTVGMLAANIPAVFLGDKLAAKVQMKWVRWVAASIFFVFGALSLWAALRGGVDMTAGMSAP